MIDCSDRSRKSYRMLPIRYGSPCRGEVGDFRFFARSVDPKCRRSVQEAFAVQVNFHAFGRTGRQCRVEQHGFFADAAFETVPPVRFVRVCRIVSPQIEIGSQETFGRMLADELFQFRPRRPFVPRQLFLPFDPDVAFGQQVLPGRNVPASRCMLRASSRKRRRPAAAAAFLPPLQTNPTGISYSLRQLFYKFETHP